MYGFESFSCFIFSIEYEVEKKVRFEVQDIFNVLFKN